jgi:hypothetical protein
MDKYVYLESSMADRLGLSQATIRKARRMFLKEGRDFGRISHESRRRVAYTKEGAERIVSSMLESPVFGSRATASIKAGDMSSVLRSSIVREAGASAHEEKEETGESQGTPAENAALRLTAPWEVPEAVLIVVRLTKNRRILEATLHEQWVRDHGYQYYHRVLFKLLRDHELNNPDLFKTKLFRVKVKDSRNFIRGMEVRARWLQQDLWECTQRMPRYKGRW